MPLHTLDELFHEQLKDLYSAEKQLTKALPKMAKAATTPELKSAFQSHLAETEIHVERLEQIGETLGKKLTGKKCAAMEGLVEEGKEVLEEEGSPAVIDAALIAAAQRVEHYEIASYGTVRALAELLNHSDVAEILKTTLDEEGAANEKLTEIASEVNSEALSSNEEEEDEEEEEETKKPSRQSDKGKAMPSKPRR